VPVGSRRGPYGEPELAGVLLHHGLGEDIDERHALRASPIGPLSIAVRAAVTG
jgi:hypothetical protein